MNKPLLAALVASSLLVPACKTAETPKPTPAPVAKPEPVVARVEVDAGVHEVSKQEWEEQMAAKMLAAAPALPELPKGLAPITAPPENALTAEKADLGHKLFFDKRLSKDGSMACAACHHIDKAYTSGNALDAKVGGAMNKRNAPTMVNLAYHAQYYWDGRMPTLEAVSNAAWKGQLGADPATVAKQLNEVPAYKAMFNRAFGTTAGATADNVPQALASFFRALNNGNSAWDKFMAGDKAALSKEAQSGWKTFQSAGCVTCHVPPLFTDFGYHNIGLGDDAGRKDATKADADVGKFKTPTLRNVALTAPYFHDGSAVSLPDAVKLMVEGGKKNANLDPALKPQKLVSKDLTALKAFLESLSGESTYTKEPELP